MIEHTILIDIPDEIESERLLIRSPMPGDGHQLRQVILKNQDYLNQWLPWAAEILDEEGYEALVREKRVNFIQRKDLMLLLLLKGENRIIGASGLHRIDWQVPKFEIGYWIDRDFEGKGYISEAVTAIERFAFDHLKANRVEIRCNHKNLRSVAVARRLNYRLEATFHNFKRHHISNELADELIFAKTPQTHKN